MTVLSVRTNGVDWGPVSGADQFDIPGIWIWIWIGFRVGELPIALLICIGGLSFHTSTIFPAVLYNLACSNHV